MFESCRGHFAFLQFSEGFEACPTINRPDCWSVPGRWANDTKWRSLVPNGPSRGGIKAYRDIGKVGREEPCIVIERRRSRLMAK